MSEEINQNPRKAFDAAVDYALQVSTVYLRLLSSRDIQLDGMKYLEIGPGSDFAPQLVLASSGVEVTLADRFLATWDPDYHPRFYSAFLDRWPGEAATVKQAIANGGYAGLISLIPEPAEDLRSLPSGYFTFVQSNAVLEHVGDIDKVVAELARVTATGGIHAHQIDLRDHRNFEDPLGHLLLDDSDYRKLRLHDNGNHGTVLRLPEFIEAFVKYFWLCEVETEPPLGLEYVRKIKSQLPLDSPYRTWPEQALRTIGARVWVVKKPRHRVWKPLRRRIAMIGSGAAG